MSHDSEILDFLLRHLNAIQDNNIPEYLASTHPELTLYEWWVTPHRIDGLPFHEFMMAEHDRMGTSFGFDIIKSNEGTEARTRFDLANLRIQRFGDMSVASYTLLLTVGRETGVTVSAHNESRVMAFIDGKWQVVHVHKSPAWPAPYQP